MAVVCVSVTSGCHGRTTATPTMTPTMTAPRSCVPSRPPRNGAPEHVVVVVFENKADQQIAGQATAPYLNSLGTCGARYTQAFGETHPSQPNYLALFSGGMHGVTDNRCPIRLRGQPNLGRQLLDRGLSFTGYAEDLPRPGFTGCTHARYAAKHNPWVSFDNVPASANQPLSAFPDDFSTLPTVSFVVPNMCHDMHDCSVGIGDTWLRTHVDGYLAWAYTHHSVLLVTFDEDDGEHDNQIFTVLSGAGVTAGQYTTRVDHYTMLATLQQWFGLSRLGASARTAPLPGAGG
jgi:acid phosphatase